MIRSDCIHLAGYEQYDERYCNHSSRCEFITTCAGCDLYERVMTPTDVLLLKVDDFMDENARLRELVSEMFSCVEITCGNCWSGVTDVRRCDNSNCGCRQIYDTMRELGIEVRDE